jgi:hypothetical protein
VSHKSRSTSIQSELRTEVVFNGGKAQKTDSHSKKRKLVSEIRVASFPWVLSLNFAFSVFGVVLVLNYFTTLNSLVSSEMEVTKYSKDLAKQDMEVKQELLQLSEYKSNLRSFNTEEFKNFVPITDTMVVTSPELSKR